MTEYVRQNGSRKIVEVKAGRGTSMQVLISSEETPNFALRKFVMQPHGGIPTHTNLVEHEQFVLKGSAVVKIGDQVIEVFSGDSVYIPAKVPHSYEAGSEGFEFLCAVPNKEDKIELLDQCSC
jgi:quercetin dioxygenase-like cupin family protein